MLKAVLEPRGLQVNRVRRHCADQAAQAAPPSVVVLHSDEAQPEPLPGTSLDEVPRVIIGTAQLPEPASGTSHYLQHPFHYRELIAAIEQLLGSEAALHADESGTAATLRAA